MRNYLSILLIIMSLLISSHSLSSSNSCYNSTINDNSSTHINIATNIEQCINIINNTQENIAIISNTLGAHLQIIESSSNGEMTAIVGDSYFSIEKSKTTHLEVIAKSTAGDRLKISISTEKEAENIIFKNHAINFLLLGLIFSNITVNFLYGILKKSKASLYLGLLTSLTIIYFIFESSSNQFDISSQASETLVKLLSLSSCIAGFLLLHALIKTKKPLSRIISLLIIFICIIGLAPSIPLASYRLFFIAVVLHVFINILIACKQQPNLWWYLIGSSIPSAISLSLILINDLLPTIASYNLMLLAIFLQNLLISKAIFQTKKEQRDANLSIEINNNDFKNEYLKSFQDILQPQLAGVVQLIKHSAPQLPSDVCASSAAKIQLVELYLSAHQLQKNINPQQLATHLIDILRLNNISQSTLQHDTTVTLLYTKADEATINICQEIISLINLHSKTIIQSSVIDDYKLFISHHHAAKQTTHSTPKNHWLIVDDNQNLLSVMAAQCASIEQETVTTQTPAAAIEHFLSNTLSITDILIDWNLEQETAYNTLKRINSLLQHHKLASINTHIMSAQKIYSASFSEFPLVEVLEKPITIDKLKKIKTSY